MKKILVVDDNHEILDLFEIILYRDYELVLATNGFEAINLISQEKPDLVITDVAMPVMDGIRLFNQLRRQDDGHHIPVVAVTNFAKSYPRKSLLAMGFAAVIPKPFVKEDVTTAVKNALEIRQ